MKNPAKKERQEISVADNKHCDMTSSAIDFGASFTGW